MATGRNLKTIKKRGAHGGKRKGSGRKLGAATKRTREIADKEAATGKITPLEVMLDNMRHFHKTATDAEAVLLTLGPDVSKIKDPEEQFRYTLAKVQEAAKLRVLAQDCARDAAPFMHARLSTIEPGKTADQSVPLAERLKEYARKRAIDDSAGKVVELPKRSARGP